MKPHPEDKAWPWFGLMMLGCYQVGTVRYRTRKGLVPIVAAWAKANGGTVIVCHHGHIKFRVNAAGEEMPP